MNYFDIQAEDGAIDGKPGLAGQRGRYHAAPMLACLAWKLYEKSEDRDFITKVFPQLQKFFWSWFSPEYDDDHDGLPQWKHVLQTGFEDNPLFDAWHEWSLGANISQVHSPSLEALLYHEAACLIKIAEQLDHHDSLILLHEQAATLRKSIESAWQARPGLAHYRERGTASSLAGKMLVKQQGAGMFAPKLKFESPIRLLIEVQTQSPGAKRPEIRIHQFSTKPADEIIQSGDYQWRNGGLVFTTKKVFFKNFQPILRAFKVEGTVSTTTPAFAP